MLYQRVEGIMWVKLSFLFLSLFTVSSFAGEGLLSFPKELETAHGIDWTCEVRGRTGFRYFGYGDLREAETGAFYSCFATNDQPCYLTRCWVR